MLLVKREDHYTSQGWGPIRFIAVDGDTRTEARDAWKEAYALQMCEIRRTATVQAADRLTEARNGA